MWPTKLLLNKGFFLHICPLIMSVGWSRSPQHQFSFFCTAIVFFCTVEVSDFHNKCFSYFVIRAMFIILSKNNLTISLWCQLEDVRRRLLNMASPKDFDSDATCTHRLPTTLSDLVRNYLFFLADVRGRYDAFRWCIRCSGLTDVPSDRRAVGTSRVSVDETAEPPKGFATSRVCRWYIGWYFCSARYEQA